MKVDRMIAVPNGQETSRLGKIASAVGNFLPASFAASFATSIVVSARLLPDHRGQSATAELSRAREAESVVA